MSEFAGTDQGHLAVATLVRTIPVRVVDVSSCGCRLEAGRWVAPGASGRLTIEMKGGPRLDDVRIARCQQRVGGGRVYLVGAELLRTRRLHRRSVRLEFGRIISEQARGAGHADGIHSEPAPPESMDRREQREKAGSRAPPVPVLVSGS